jgi:hypothetical protein
MTSMTPPEPGRRRISMPHLRQRRASAWPRTGWPPAVKVVPCDVHPGGHQHAAEDLLMSPTRLDPDRAWVVTSVCPGPDGHVNVFWWSHAQAQRGLIDGVPVLYVPAKHAPPELRDVDRDAIGRHGPIRKDEVDQLTHAMASPGGDAEIARWIARF